MDDSQDAKIIAAIEIVRGCLHPTAAYLAGKRKYIFFFSTGNPPYNHFGESLQSF
jgi:hypothetical protein